MLLCLAVNAPASSAVSGECSAFPRPQHRSNGSHQRRNPACGPSKTPMAEQKHEPEVLWRPQNAGATPMDRYRTHVNDKFGQDLRTTRDLQRWSVRQPQNFVSVVYQGVHSQFGFLVNNLCLPRLLMRFSGAICTSISNSLHHYQQGPQKPSTIPYQ